MSGRTTFQYILLGFLFLVSLSLLVLHTLPQSGVQADFVSISLIIILIFLTFSPNISKVGVSTDGVTFELDQLRQVDVSDYQRTVRERFEHILTQEELNKADVESESDSQDTEQYVRSLLDTNPRSAVVQLQIELEKALEDIGENEDVGFDEGRGMMHYTNVLRERGILDTQITNGLRQIQEIRNKAVHGAEIENEEAKEIVNIGLEILESLLQYESTSEMAGELVERTVAENIEKVEPGLKVDSVQRERLGGRFDFVCQSETGETVLVEIKTHEVESKTVSTLQSAIEKGRSYFENEKIRGIIVAPSISEKSEAIIQDSDIKHVDLYSVVNLSTQSNTKIAEMESEYD